MPMVDFRQARFLTSVAAIRGLPSDDGREVAFAGRSNAGKSSAINAITGRRRLARTSRTPGRTRLINLFELDGGRRLVDLPGYGYAKVSRPMTRAWGALVGRYLEVRESLVGVVVLMDIRHPLTELDETLLDWCRCGGAPGARGAHQGRQALPRTSRRHAVRGARTPLRIRRPGVRDGVLRGEADRTPRARGTTSMSGSVATPSLRRLDPDEARPGHWGKGIRCLGAVDLSVTCGWGVILARGGGKRESASTGAGSAQIGPVSPLESENHRHR